MMRRSAGRCAASMFVAVALSGGATMALAGEIAEKAALAETLVDRGYPEAALAALDKAVAAFWEESPLQLRTIVFVDGVAGYGDYTPRDGTLFRNGDTLRLYFEPVGYAFATDGDDVSAAIGVDVQIRTPGGLILATAEDFATLEWRGRTPMREVQATVETRLPFLKPGEYLLLLTLRDRNSDKVKDVTLPFSMAE
jgi:hypothetical protein